MSRAATEALLDVVEARVSPIVAHAGAVVASFFGGGSEEVDVDAALVGARGDATAVRPDDVERHAAWWRELVPADPARRAELLHALLARYPLTWDGAPRLRAALGVDDPAVAAAYRARYGAEPARAFAAERADVGDRGIEPDLEWVALARGERLFSQGDAGDALYIVVNGRLRIVLEPATGARRVLSEVGRGELVGEMALITGQPRSATAEAARDSELVRLPKASFERLVDREPRAMLRLARALVLRLQRRTAAPARVARAHLSLAVIAGSADVPLREVAGRLASALGPAGATLHLDAALADDRLGAGAAQSPPDDFDASRVVAWLTEQESRHRYLVYQADASPSEWTARCLRQADRVLLVVDAEVGPAPTSLEQELTGRAAEAGVQVELVLLHRNGDGPARGTAAWLDARSVATHHHLQLGRDADVARLARRATGRAIGLALGGGGARGLAHIGVYRALQECGVPVDVVGGTSMGAIVGAQIALGWDAATIQRRCRQVFGGGAGALLDLTLPVVSLLTGRQMAAQMAALCGDADVEDLWTSFFCVSSNLSRGDVEVHRRGRLRTCLRASGSVAGILPPVARGGDLLVDGGVLNNLPADLVRAACPEGLVVAVNVDPREGMRTALEYGEALTARQALAGRMGNRGRVPGLQEILERVTMLGSIQHSARLAYSVDLYLHPATDPFSMGAFRDIERIVEVGYREALPLVAAWRARHTARLA
jgi:predicted acylesterase/phospholipase RssA/CRP-like cAMP-binding protein